MKILKKQDVSNWTHKHTCANCESELEVEPKDLTHTHYDGDMREPGYDNFNASCAVCSQSFTVPIAKIPKLIQIEAKNRSAASRHGGEVYYRD